MTPLNKMVTVCSWLLASSALFATAQAQDVSRYELSGARVRVRCCGSNHWITGVVTSQSDASVTIDALSERRTFSRTDAAEFERSLGKPRYVVVWSTTVGAAVGYGVGYQLGGGGRSDLSGALGGGLGGLLGLASGAVAGAVLGFVFRREEWLPVVDPWHLRREHWSKT